MQIKDIVNRDIVNLTNCEHEPIHIPGSIQPHGFLLGIKQADLTIEYCSANCKEYLRYSLEQLLGKKAETIFDAGDLERLKLYIASALASDAPLTINIDGSVFACTCHTSGSIYILEFEPFAGDQLGVRDVFMQTRQFTQFMQHAASLKELSQFVADETRAITGYDRVMIYKFDKDYNGEVFAESRNDKFEPFLGLHYPHTDIPAQARELYMRNLVRLIVDVNYTPVPLYTIDDVPGKNLDLSLSVLRSVSPIHIEYLQNIGVGATLTISLLYEGKLWGLIACHHYSAKYVSMHTRMAAQLQGHFLTSQIGVRQEAEEYKIAVDVNVALDSLIAKVFSTAPVTLQQLVQEPELLQITNADGVIIGVEDDIFIAGKTPSREQIANIVRWLTGNSVPSGFSTHKLADAYPGATDCIDASGIIYHPLGGVGNNFILWCRTEELQVVNWAGDPNKAIIKNEKGLSPRNSFELWKEVKRCESREWRKPELMAAASFASALQRHVHMLVLGKEELKQRTLSEKLRKANAELENINWIGSHDLKEPLRKIQMFASRILDDESEMNEISTRESVSKMQESANRMHTLIHDILAYSRLTHIEQGFTTLDLNKLLEEILVELKDEIAEKNATIDTSDLPVVRGVKVLLSQLFLNLLRNALKFSQPGVAPHISLTCGIADDVSHVLPGRQFTRVTVRDNGIGFDNKYKETIFNVFTRLHHKDTFRGTGVGLALCRKIMENHNGFIEAEGTPGEGAAFHLYFPPIDEEKS